MLSDQGSRPKRRTVPESCLRIPSRMRIVVDLPAPFGPRKPWTSPGWTSRLSPSSARSEPYDLTRFEMLMTGSLRWELWRELMMCVLNLKGSRWVAQQVAHEMAQWPGDRAGKVRIAVV